MKQEEIRTPVQKRSIEKKKKIIKYGFELICKKGYHNTNTPEIAKAAGVSTGIIYQYFKDKHDIFLQGLEQYSKELLFPIAQLGNNKKITNLEEDFRIALDACLKSSLVSESAQEEIYAMEYTDPDVAKIFLTQEIEATNTLIELLELNNIHPTNIKEKAHLIIHLVENLCQEVSYHRHKEMNYDIMKEIIINNVMNMLNN